MEDNIERLAEWLYNQHAKDIQRGETDSRWLIAPSWEALRKLRGIDTIATFYRNKARSLLTFLDSLGFVQKDKDQSYGFIWTDEAGVFIKYRCPDGFVRVKSILPEGK
jgi:hypothetical protein